MLLSGVYNTVEVLLRGEQHDTQYWVLKSLTPEYVGFINVVIENQLMAFPLVVVHSVPIKQ